LFSPIREKINYFKNDTDALAKAAKIGAEKANESANKTLLEVRDIIGFKNLN
jgi:tryptophanyl-tRNA synthetase